MKQRGRKSVAALSVIAGDDQSTRPAPPVTLSEPERELFVAIVSDCDVGHFRNPDLPLLSRYCEAAVLAEQAALQLRKVPLWTVGQAHGLWFRRSASGLWSPYPCGCVYRRSRESTENFGQAAALLRTKPLGSCRMTAAAERRDQFISLAERYCKLGRLLPAVGDIDTNDIAAIAEASLILWEMSKTKSAMDALLQRPV